MDVRRLLSFAAAALGAGVLAGPAAAAPSTGGAAYAPPVPKTRQAQAQPAGGSVPTSPTATTTTPATPTAVATLAPDGTAIAPAGAPPEVVAAIEAANRIAKLPYRYGGGHRSFDDRGYDCSGSVSYALHAANLLDSPLTSSGLMTWGRSGPGAWITLYSNPEHVFAVIAGLRFDTSGQKARGSRWQPMDRSTKGFVVRHPDGL